MDLKKKNALAYDRGLFRYVVLEPLLTSPPTPGELAERLREISRKSHIRNAVDCKVLRTKYFA